jgi:aspartate carbamoyltransferase regulatory subunit
MKCAYCETEHDEVFVHGRCHPASPTWAILTEHSVTIRCAECDKFITEIARAI